MHMPMSPKLPRDEKRSLLKTHRESFKPTIVAPEPRHARGHHHNNFATPHNLPPATKAGLLHLFPHPKPDSQKQQ